MQLSALIIAKNEEDKIKNTLDSLSFADEIVIILDRSTDQTRQKSNDYTKKIYEGSWISEGKRRNYGISKCSSEWILEVDADEVINKNLRFEIGKKIKDENIDYYYIPLTNYIGKKKIDKGWMACLAPDGKFCLFKKGRKKWMKGSVHPEYKLNGQKGIGFCNSIDHYMSRNLTDLLMRFNRNTSLYAQDLNLQKIKKKKLLSIRKIFSRFFKSYLSRGGIKLGGVGILIGLLCAIYPYVSAVKFKIK